MLNMNKIFKKLKISFFRIQLNCSIVLLKIACKNILDNTTHSEFEEMYSKQGFICCWWNFDGSLFSDKIKLILILIIFVVCLRLCKGISLKTDAPVEKATIWSCQLHEELIILTKNLKKCSHSFWLLCYFHCVLL